MKFRLKAKHIPNILSIVRLLLVPVFAAVFFLYESDHRYRVALFIFLFAGLTDVVDGFLARKFGWVTVTGKILDPLADKLMQCTALVCLSAAGLVESWFTSPYILKELVMLFGGLLVIKSRKVVVVSNVFGKLAAVVFYVVLGVVMIVSVPGQTEIPLWIDIICGISLVMTILALVMYMVKYLFVKPQPTVNTVSNSDNKLENEPENKT